MVALDPTDVIAEHLVLAIPDALTNLLRVHVIRDQSSRALRAGSIARRNFDRATQPWKLRWTTGGAPLPPVPQIANAKVVSDSRREGTGETDDPKLTKLWLRRGVEVFPLSTTEQTTNVDLNVVRCI